jgi:hypothetical protein
MTTVPVKTKRFVECTACGKDEYCLEPLFSQLSEREPVVKVDWYCDECGALNLIEVRDSGVTIAIDPHKRISHTSVVLSFQPKNKPIYMLVEGRRYHDASKPRDGADGSPVEHDRYFYEEHTCPTNWLPNVVEVVYDGQVDPHEEIVTYIATLLGRPKGEVNGAEQLPGFLQGLGLSHTAKDSQPKPTTQVG